MIPEYHTRFGITYPNPERNGEKKRHFRVPTAILTAVMLFSLGVGCFLALGAVPHVEPVIKEALR
jgi:hypothetical protein